MSLSSFIGTVKLLITKLLVESRIMDFNEDDEHLSFEDSSFKGKGLLIVQKVGQKQLDDHDMLPTTCSSAVISHPPVSNATPKTLNDHTDAEYRFVVAIGLSMAFVAGYSNSVCLSGFMSVDTAVVRQSVAGVTGLYTSSAIAVGNKDWTLYLFHTATFLCVMAGSCISSLMNPFTISFDLSPGFGSTFLIGSCFSLLGALSSLHNERREFYFTALGNGIMNGIASMYSANLLRATHMTGTTTDIGLFIGQFLRGNKTNLWKLYILSGLASSFWIGSLVGYQVSKVQRSNALLLNAAFFFLMGFSIIVYYTVVENMNFFDALFGIGRIHRSYGDIAHKVKKNDLSDHRNLSENELELMEIFDRLDVRSTGTIDREELIYNLLSDYTIMKAHLKSVIGIIHLILEEYNPDSIHWELQRLDWERFVRHYLTKTNVEHETIHVPGSSMRQSMQQIQKFSNGAGGARASMAMYRLASIFELQGAGYEFPEDDE